MSNISQHAIAFTPQMAEERHREALPDKMIETVNELLGIYFSGAFEYCTITQDEIVKRFCAKQGVSESVVHARNWLEIERVFNNAGWHVTFVNNPGRGRDHNPSFIFRRAEQESS